MESHSDEVYKRYANHRKKFKSIEFACANCLNMFYFEYEDIYLNNSGDIEFVPEPTCPRCGSSDDLVFSDFGQEKIEDMLFSGQIRKVK